MRQRIKIAVIDGQAREIKETRNYWGDRFTHVLATTESPEHARGNIRKVAAYRRNTEPTAAETAWRERENRRAAFMAMPRRDYKQVYGL